MTDMLKALRRGLVAEHGRDDLEGCCAIASYALTKVVPGAKFVVGCYVTKGKIDNRPIPMDHCWVQAGNEIVDITATQFKSTNPKILRATVGDTRFAGELKGRLAEKFVALHWPDEQIPQELQRRWR